MLNKDEMSVLRNRFQVCRARARAGEIPFCWDNFEEYYLDVSELAPDDYTSSGYRISFDRSELTSHGKGYCRGTMQIRRVGASQSVTGKTRKKQPLELVPEGVPAAFTSEDVAQARYRGHQKKKYSELEVQLVVALGTPSLEHEEKCLEGDFNLALLVSETGE